MAPVDDVDMTSLDRGPAAGAPPAASAPLLDMRGITKAFPGTIALDRVDFAVAAGEIHALVGENGAGKSTLIKILADVHEADAGDILIAGRPRATYANPPISFIHQDLGLVGAMTVAENIAIVAGYPRPRGLISWRGAREHAVALLRSIGSDVDPDDRVATLSSADQSLVAIARATAVAADILILDEPTASLPVADVRRLFDTLRTLRARGLGIVFVTHRLDEVFQLADRVTVIRDGRNVITTRVADTNPGELIRHIVGRDLSDMFGSPAPPESASLLDVRALRVNGVGPIDLRLRSGEILGLVGLRGAGQDAVARALFGAMPDWSGDIRFDGDPIRPRDPAAAMRLGIAFVSGKRAEESIAASLTVRENVYPNPVIVGTALLGWLAKGRERRRIVDAVRRFNIRPPDPERSVGTLSGGNQQKTVLARWLEADSRLLLLEEPTSGVDVGAKAEIYALLRQHAARGRGVVLVSSDFEEIAGLCHRALVFRRGRVVAEAPREQLTVGRLTQLATGAARAPREAA
jgi:ribose transport system ATP-binding protein